MRSAAAQSAAAAARRWRWLPPRFAELPGVQHIKVAASDRESLVSGANLSDDYLTQRQDRSLLFTHNAPLADYHTRLVDHVLVPFAHRMVARTPASVACALSQLSHATGSGAGVV